MNSCWQTRRVAHRARSQRRRENEKKWIISSSVEDKEEKTSDSSGDDQLAEDKKHDDDLDLPPWASTLGGLLAWAAFLGYGFFLSPNQTPDRDAYLVQKLFNLTPEDGFHVNIVFSSIFFLLGILPVVYTSLIIPAAQSKNKIPAWPFLTGMFAFGNFAFLPYAALWEPDPSVAVPPTKQDLEGWSRVVLRVTESALFPLLLLFPSGWLLLQMVICGSEEWLAFYQFFEESRLVHVSTLDFISLILLTPFWMNNDATAREWKAKDQLLLPLSCLPVLGPIVYLILRPKGTKRNHA